MLGCTDICLGQRNKIGKLHSEHSGCCAHNDDRGHAHDHDHDHGHSHGGDGGFNLKKELILLALVAVLYIPGLILEGRLHPTLYSFVEYLLFIPAYFISGWTVLTSAGRNILRGRIFDENFLMTVATLALFCHFERFPRNHAVSANEKSRFYPSLTKEG